MGCVPDAQYDVREQRDGAEDQRRGRSLARLDSDSRCQTGLFGSIDTHLSSFIKREYNIYILYSIGDEAAQRGFQATGAY